MPWRGPGRGAGATRCSSEGTLAVGRQAGVRGELHDPLEASGMVGVVVGQPDPPKVTERDDRLQGRKERGAVDPSPVSEPSVLRGVETEDLFPG